MKEEVLRILRMVEEGKITADEAERLLSALESLKAHEHRVGIFVGRKAEAGFVERELPGRDGFALAISASKAELSLWEEDRVKVEAWLDELGSVEETSDGLRLNMARAKIRIPAERSLRLELSAGKAEGEVPPITDITCSAGKAELRGLREGTVSCSAGKVEVALSAEPGVLSLDVSAGKIELLVPKERKMHIIKEEVSACGVFVDEGIEDPSAPQATVRGRAGKVSIRKA
ncbi:MAG: hypothetical protein ABIM74_09020 [candidate division WOR-3 bacterium]